jgi:hypothetical protein
MPRAALFSAMPVQAMVKYCGFAAKQEKLRFSGPPR